jgi:hypothetical protein
MGFANAAVFKDTEHRLTICTNEALIPIPQPIFDASLPAYAVIRMS